MHTKIVSTLPISKCFTLALEFEIVANIFWTIYIYAVSVEKYSNSKDHFHNKH